MKSTAAVYLYQYISLHVGTLKFFDIWLYKPKSILSFKFWFYWFKQVIVGILIYIIPTTGQIIYLIEICVSGNAGIQDIAAIVNLVSTEMLATYKLIHFHFHRNAVRQLLNELNNNEFHCFDGSHKKIIDKGIKFSRRLFTAFMISAACDVFVHVIVVPGLKGFKYLPLKMDLVFFDITDSKYFNYICAYQILYKPMMVSTYMSLQALPWAFMIFAINQLDILIKKLQNIEDLVKETKQLTGLNDEEAFKSVFKDCILHYFAILRNIKILQKALGGQLSSTLFISVIILCNTAVQIFSIESPHKNITEVFWVLTYLFIFVLNLFLDCYFGNEITVKSSYLSTAIYNSPWLKLSKGVKKNIAIFIFIAQQPVTLRAANLAPVSVATFTTVMNWTYKAFAVMNQMK
ncbi:odorant receptor 46a-like [Achroia grisella]|uniref:odorant receptor 46a-like n=1 Tax=Achroia grisella TaxID=688607 RepID=UPI0027D249B6|nr:odorant receptor 46a-like [Achroia grisella]